MHGKSNARGVSPFQLRHATHCQRPLFTNLVYLSLQPGWTAPDHVWQVLRREGRGASAHGCEGVRESDRSSGTAPRARGVRASAAARHQRGWPLAGAGDMAAAGCPPRMLNMRREHSRWLGLHSYWRYWERCADPRFGTASRARARSSGHAGERQPYRVRNKQS